MPDRNQNSFDMNAIFPLHRYDAAELPYLRARQHGSAGDSKFAPAQRKRQV